MALSIRNPETEAAVRELAELTGLGLTETIDMAVRAQLASPSAARQSEERQRARITEARAWITENVDTTLIRSDDELYDEHGLPR